MGTTGNVNGKVALPSGTARNVKLTGNLGKFERIRPRAVRRRIRRAVRAQRVRAAVPRTLSLQRPLRTCPLDGQLENGVTGNERKSDQNRDRDQDRNPKNE